MKSLPGVDLLSGDMCVGMFVVIYPTIRVPEGVGCCRVGIGMVLVVGIPLIESKNQIPVLEFLQLEVKRNPNV